MDEQQINSIGQPKQALLEKPKKSWLSLILKIVAGVVIILILGTGIALASRIWDPLWNPFRPSPEMVLKNMVGKMQKVSSVHTEVDFRMDGVGEASSTSLTAKLIDSSDTSDLQNPKSDGKLTMGIETQGVQLSAEASYLASGKDLYIRLNNVPTIPILPIDLSSLKGKWIRMTGLSNDSQELTGLMQTVKNFSGNSNLMTVKKELLDEKAGGVNSYHYIAGFKEEGIKDFIKILLEETSNLTTSSKEIIQAQTDEIAQKIGALEIEYWIGKKDELLRKVKLETRFVDDDQEAVIGITLNLSDFNKPVSVKTPDIYTNAEDLMKDFAPLLEGITK
jgi:hypothetical protein